ncbi:MAG: Ig-like domain-containing protein [Candidatus Omnitrophica bacterium]|nr:Ig-like domain-containing protein [Candidatus Omnitrophota bacterium]
MKNTNQKIKNKIKLQVSALLWFVLLASNGLCANDMTADNYSFSVITDGTAPTVSSLAPQANATNVPRSTNIKCTITDNLSGIDSSTIDLNVEAVDIIVNGVTQTFVNNDGQTVAYDVEIVEKNANEFVISYDPNEYFNYEDTINVIVRANDLDGNALNNYSYSFISQGLVYGTFNSFANMSASNLSASSLASVLAYPIQDNSMIATSADGKNVYVAWEQKSISGQYNIYMASSLDFGKNFSSLVQVNPVEAGIDHRCPTIDLDAQGNIYVAWQQNASLDWDIYLAKLNSGDSDFSDSYLVYNDSGVSNQTKPSIAVGSALTSDGNVNTVEPSTIYVAWIDDNNSADQAYYTRTTALYSDAWYQFVNTAIRADNDRFPQTCADVKIALDSSANIYLAWRGINDNQTYSIYFDKAAKTTIDGNESFGTDVVVSNATSNSKAPALAVSDDGNKVFVLWKQLDGAQAKLQLSHYAYSIAQSKYLISTMTQVNTSILADSELNEYSLQINSDNDAFVVWSQMDGASSVINMAGAAHDAYLFSDYANFSTNGSQVKPFLVTDTAGYHFFISWTDNSSGTDAIMFCRNTGIATDQIKTQRIANDVGGTVTVTEGNIIGASVSITADSIDAPIEIAIAEVVAAPANTADMQKISNVVDFGPGGTTFTTNATIAIPYTDAELAAAGVSNESILQIYYYNLDTALWEVVAGSVVNTSSNIITVGTNHFSMYTVGSSTIIDGSSSVPTAVAASSTSGGGGGGGCFIATAAFGTYMEPEVQVLRDFRDEYLLTNYLGSEFVKFYYRNSPPIADFIAQNETLKKIIRIGLKPLIKFGQAICK